MTGFLINCDGVLGHSPPGNPHTWTLFGKGCQASDWLKPRMERCDWPTRNLLTRVDTLLVGIIFWADQSLPLLSFVPWEFRPGHYFVFGFISILMQARDLSTSLTVIRKRRSRRSWGENEEHRTWSGNETNSWLIVCVSPKWNMTRLDKMRRGTKEICQHNIHQKLGVRA